LLPMNPARPQARHITG